MSDHDKVELVAAAQVQVIGGSPGSITFSSNQGFDTASRGNPGVYELRLDHKHDDHKLVVNVTRKSAPSAGTIQAEILGVGDVDGILVTNFDMGGLPADTSFFITVWRVRS
jgi:hypothetical protein